jgi:diaminopimelate decarboxylase
MNDLIRPALYGSYHHIIPIEKNNKGYIKADIVGPVCETGDFLALDRKIQKLSRGDYIAVLSSGAYGFSMSSHYNLRTKPTEILVENEKYKITRKRKLFDF